jgi:hypothetical protein
MLGGLDYKSITTAVRRALNGILGSSGSDGYSLVKSSDVAAGVLFAPPGLGYNLVGGYLDWTVAANVLTCAVKAWSGNDPSGAEPVYYAVRDVTASTGTLTYRKLTSPLSVTLNNTALIGTVNSIAFRLWAAIFNDAGVDRLSLINCLSTSANAGSGRNADSIYPLAGWAIASAVLSDNAADNAQVFYANAAIASKAYTVAGYATWEAGLAAAGTWSAAPTRKQLFGPGVPLPGQTIQTAGNAVTGFASAATSIPFDNTIPQSGEGTQYMSQAITPSSAANVLKVETCSVLANSGAQYLISALFQDAVANALAAIAFYQIQPGVPTINVMNHRMLAGTTVATTFKVRSGSNDVATTTSINGNFGGVENSYMNVTEIMA